MSGKVFSHTFSKADLGKLAVVPSRYVNVTVGITLFEV